MTQTDTPIAEMAERLTSGDRMMFLLAREYPSGVWLGGPCKHLYPLNLCRLTGELTESGLALRSHLMGGSDRGK